MQLQIYTKRDIYIFPIGSSPAAIGHSREVPDVTVSLSGAEGWCIQTDGQPHRLHQCHKATMIGIRHSFDPDVHDNRSLLPFLFDSIVADQFLSILALLPQLLPVAAIVRPLTASTFILKTFCLNARVRKGRLSSTFSISTINLSSSNLCYHNRGSWP